MYTTQNHIKLLSVSVVYVHSIVTGLYSTDLGCKAKASTSLRVLPFWPHLAAGRRAGAISRNPPDMTPALTAED